MRGFNFYARHVDAGRAIALATFAANPTAWDFSRRPRAAIALDHVVGLR